MKYFILPTFILSFSVLAQTTLPFPTDTMALRDFDVMEPDQFQFQRAPLDRMNTAPTPVPNAGAQSNDSFGTTLQTNQPSSLQPPISMERPEEMGTNETIRRQAQEAEPENTTRRPTNAP